MYESPRTTSRRRRSPGPHADSPLTRRSKWHGDAVWRGASMWHGDAARYHAGAVVLLDEETPCIVEGYGDAHWRVRPLRSPGTLILAREERLQLRFAVLPGNVGSARGRVRLREGSGRVVVDAAVPAGAPLFEEAPFLVTPSGVARMRDERWRAYLHMQVGAQRSEAMRRALEAFDALGAGGGVPRREAAAERAARRIYEAELEGSPAARDAELRRVEAARVRSVLLRFEANQL